MRQIAFYGKGGIGKSTTTSNISVAMSKLGFKVMQIGCDPKADSTVNLTKGIKIPSILNLVRETETDDIPTYYNDFCLDDLVHEGFNGVLCCEAGGPEPGVGCAGRGIITAIESLRTYKAFETHQPDFVFYDVLGDVVCGGFAMPIRKSMAEEVYVITSAEIMAIYACNNIFKGITKFAKKGKTRVGGIILNSRVTQNEVGIIENFAEKTNTNLIHVIPRSNIVQKSEMNGMTTLEYDESSDQAKQYISLAEKIQNNSNLTVPTPLGDNEFYDWVNEQWASV